MRAQAEARFATSGAVTPRRAATGTHAGDGTGRATLEDLYRQIQAGQAKETTSTGPIVFVNT